MTAGSTARLRRGTGPLLLAGGGVAFGLLAQALAQPQSGRPDSWTLPDLAAGWSFLLAGLLVRRLRPGNRCWLLLMAVGVTWFFGTFAAAAGQNASLAGFALAGASNVVLAWLLLAYPTGRLATGRERALLGAIALLYAVRVAARLFLYVPPDGTGCGCAPNRFLPITDSRWYDAVNAAYPWAFTAGFGLALAAAVARWRRSSRPGRRMLIPVVATGAVVAVELAYSYVVRVQSGLAVPTANDLFFLVAGVRALAAGAFVIGLRRLRSSRSAVVDLVGGLPEHGAAPDRLTAALRRALGDPSLELAAWSPEESAYVRADGRHLQPGVGPLGRATTVITGDDRPIAALIHDEALLEDPGLVSAIVAAVRLTADNERLRDELEHQLAEVAASRARIVASGDAERRRIERDLHDGAQQRLVTIALALRLTEARMSGGADPATRQALSQAVKDLGEAVDELRDLARGIHPAVLSESGLAVALESLADRSTLPVHLSVRPFREPSVAVATAAYYVVAECLTNVVKHARATSATVNVTEADHGLMVEVMDDGAGGAAPAPRSGLTGLVDRVTAVGGTLSLDSETGRGTHIRVWLPCA